jgi:hypothetical protein
MTLETFDWFTKRPASYINAHGQNGYVVIPDEWTNDYTDKFWDQIDTTGVQGLTFGGYAVEYDKGDIDIYHDRPNHLKMPIAKVVGFDDAHAYPNEDRASVCAEYLAGQMRELWEKMK